jgi:hypothetical protein
MRPAAPFWFRGLMGLNSRRGLRPSGRGDPGELVLTSGVPLRAPMRTRMHEAVMAAA